MRIAVYGTLKRGMGNHRVMGNSHYLGNHVTEPKYTMYSLGGFPAITKEGNTPITCEIYYVPNPRDLANIYSLEGYTGTQGHPENWYDTTTIDTPYGKADIFYMTHPPSAQTIDTGIWQKN